MSEKQGRHTGHRHMGHGPMHGMGAGEKAKDFKGTLKKLLHYLSMFKVQMFFVFLFAVGGTVFNIVGPKILGKATTEIFNGLVSKVYEFGNKRVTEHLSGIYEFLEKKKMDSLRELER